MASLEQEYTFWCRRFAHCLGDLRLARHLPAVAGLVVGIPISLLILIALPPDHLGLAIGAIILLSVLLIQCGVRLPSNPSILDSSGVGRASGIINGLGLMGGSSIILVEIRYSAICMRAISIVYFMLAACMSLLPMAWRELITRNTLLWLVETLFGSSRQGSWAFYRSKPRHHRLLVLITLFVLGTILIIRALFTA